MLKRFPSSPGRNVMHFLSILESRYQWFSFSSTFCQNLIIRLSFFIYLFSPFTAQSFPTFCTFLKKIKTQVDCRLDSKTNRINAPKSIDCREREREEVINRIIRRWKLFRSLNQMPLNGLQRVTLSEPGGSSLEVLLNGGQIVSWKNDRGEELLFIRNKNAARSPMSILGGISICFPQATSLVPFEPNEYVRTRLWSLDYAPLDRSSNDSQSSVNLLLQSSDKDLKKWPCRFELRIKISISPGKLTLMPSVINVGDKSFSFTFALRNCLSVSDISEVRVEGLETLDYLDNSLHKERFTEQADALTFDEEVNRVYLNTPSKIAVIDHGKKRTFVIHKQGFPDAGVWNPWDKPSKGVPYKTMLSVDSSVIEKPVVLKPCQVWRGYQEISNVSSSYCSGQLDPRKVVQGTSY